MKAVKIFTLILCLVLVSIALFSCDSGKADDYAPTEAPTTEAPTIEAPTIEAPTTEEPIVVSIGLAYEAAPYSGKTCMITGRGLCRDKDIYIPDKIDDVYTVLAIGNQAFESISITSIRIPNSVTSIGYGAFYSCRSLKSITYDGTIAEWNAIQKGGSWDGATNSYIIHCTDGDITK